ncbi:MAG: SRPBCC domain-containing protein, partial [Pseudorhodoplanes sp.]|nr:SRPBCC domain-containing protein [Pseudorhodoplanes sp.]
VQWWGPKDYPATHLEMDVRPGGVWRGKLRAVEDGRELSHRGVFREVTAPERLVFTFAWDEEGERGLETLVTISFADQNGKTLMTFRQIPFQSTEEREGHRGGWTSAFDRFDEQLQSLQGS